MLQLNDEYLWDYNVDFVDVVVVAGCCCRCRRCRTLLLIKLLSSCILIKLGAHVLLNVNHSYHVDLRAYALHVDLGVDAPHVDFRSLCSTR